jgi:hypothetical protein
MYTLKAGTILYHGTDNPDLEEDSSSLSAYSWVSTSRSVAERFAKRSGGWGGPKRVIEYRLSEDLAVHEITSAQQMRDFAEEHHIDLGSAEEMRDSAEASGIPGWIIPSNYPDGDDILIGEAHLLDYVSTELLEAPRPQWAPSADDMLQMADKLEACSSILQSSAYTPVRTTEKLLRHLVRNGTAPREVDGFSKLIKDLRYFANTVANPARERMQQAAAMLENLNEAGICT